MNTKKGDPLYELKIVEMYATILDDGLPIYILSGLYVSDEIDLQDLQKLVDLANIGREKKGDL